MNAGCFLRSWLGLCLLATSLPAQPASQPAANVQDLLNGLTAADPAVRQRASRQLVLMGSAARRQVLQAVRSDDPELRAAAAQILLQLPWELDDDPPQVRHLLREYGSPEAARRREVIRSLAELGADLGREALLRLLLEEPSDTLRWQIVAHLRGSEEEAHLKRLAELAPPADNSAALALWGWATLDHDRPRAIAALRRAAELESQRPAEDDGASDFLYETLIEFALRSRQFDEAAALTRRQIARDRTMAAAEAEAPGAGLRAPKAVFSLFALHARFGPLAKFHEDLNAYGRFLGRPQVLYCLGRLYQRGGQDLAATALYRTAGACGLWSTQTRYEVGEFLLENGLYDLADRELRAAVVNAAGDGDAHQILVVNARFRLAHIAIRRGQDFEAAEQMRQGLEGTSQTGGVLVTRGSRRAKDQRSGEAAEQGVWAEIHWRYLRAAKARGDAPEVDKRLAKLLEFSPEDPDIALEVVPLLKERRRDEDARKLFASAYAAAREHLDKHPRNPELMNNLAWLCARSDERLPEALELATEAIRIEPNNPAYLDTAAEANFRVGRVQEAIRLEERALELRPGDTFMQEQLDRFRKAAPR